MFVSLVLALQKKMILPYHNRTMLAHFNLWHLNVFKLMKTMNKFDNMTSNLMFIHFVSFLFALPTKNVQHTTSETFSLVPYQNYHQLLSHWLLNLYIKVYNLHLSIDQHSMKSSKFWNSMTLIYSVKRIPQTNKVSTGIWKSNPQNHSFRISAYSFI